MISAKWVSTRSKRLSTRNSGMAITIPGNIWVARIIIRIRLLPGMFRRARAYAAAEPTTNATALVKNAMMNELISPESKPRLVSNTRI